MSLKRPESVLVIVHRPNLDILLLRRTGGHDYWQSVTGSIEEGESATDAALREVAEETGLTASPLHLLDLRLSSRFEIFDEWRHRYAPGITHNIEHAFALPVPTVTDVRINLDEHERFRWLPWRQAAEACFSWTNRDAIRILASAATSQRS